MSSPSSGLTNIAAGHGIPESNIAQPEMEPFWQRVKKPGSVWQIST
jgi:hypothetical protein